MANYQTLKGVIDANIRNNGNGEITGNILNGVLNSMVTTLGNGYLFMGEATPTTNPGSPDNNVVYVTTTPGNYTNFGGINVVENELAFLLYDGSWQKQGFVLGSASGSSARELYMDITGQGLTDEQKAYNAETFTLLQTQGFSMFVAAEEIVLYPINSAGTYQPGDESIKLQYVQYETNSTALLIYDLSLTQGGIVTFSGSPLAYKLTPYTEDEDTENIIEYQEKVIVREFRMNVNDINKDYNARTYEKAIKGINKEGPLPMLLYNGGRSDVLTLLTIYAGAGLYDPNAGGWDFIDRTKPFIGFVSPILENMDNTLTQVRAVLYEDGSSYSTYHIINTPTQ